MEAEPATPPRDAEARILVVCPVPDDLKQLARLIRSWRCAHVLESTESADVVGLCAELQPDLVVLDLGEPEHEALEVLAHMLPGNAGRTAVPVLVLTAAAGVEVRCDVFGAGASDVLLKPVNAEELRLRVVRSLDTRRIQEDLRRHGDLVEDRVRKRVLDLDRARLEALQVLSLVSGARDDVSREHPGRVGRCAGQLAAELGCPPQMSAIIAHAATLHDIGNIAIPDAVLLKPGRLAPLEETVMRTHVDHGLELLAGSESPLLRAAHEIVGSHHEWWNGAGYPDGLRATEIPLASRLVAVADVFDALVHARPDRPALSVSEAVLRIVESSGAHFDPDVVEAFLALDHESLLAPLGAAGAPGAARAAIAAPVRQQPQLRTIGLAGASAALGVSPSTVRRWADSGRVPSQRTAGGHRRFLLNELRVANGCRAAGARPTVKRVAPPTDPLPAVAGSLIADGPQLIGLTGRLLYEGLPGWWTTPAALLATEPWIAALTTCLESGDYEPAITATRELMTQADVAGTSRLERHQFLERFFDILSRRPRTDRALRQAELVTLRRLFSSLRQTVLEDGPAPPALNVA